MAIYLSLMGQNATRREALARFWVAAAVRCSPQPFPKSASGCLASLSLFGLSVLTMAYAVGHVSGGHFNPAVTVRLCTARRFLGKEVLPHIVAQLAGAIAGAGILPHTRLTIFRETRNIQWLVLNLDRFRRRLGKSFNCFQTTGFITPLYHSLLWPAI